MRQGNSSFKNTEIVPVVYPENRQRNANLRIITFRTFDNLIKRCKQKAQPFFYDGFSVASGNADDWKIIQSALIIGKILQGCFSVFNQKKNTVFRQFFRQFFYHKITYILFE